MTGLEYIIHKICYIICNRSDKTYQKIHNVLDVRDFIINVYIVYSFVKFLTMTHFRLNTHPLPDLTLSLTVSPLYVGRAELQV